MTLAKRHLTPDFDALPLSPEMPQERPTTSFWAPTEPAPLGELLAGRIAPGGHVLHHGGGSVKLLAEPVHMGASRLIKKLLAAQTARECEQHVRAALQACGFDWYAYFTLEVGVDGPRPRGVIDTYAQRAWVQRYFAQRCYEVDPRLRQLAGSRLPVQWSIDELEALLPDAPHDEAGRLQQLVAGLRGGGLGSGVLFTVAWPPGSTERTVVSLMAPRTDRRWITGSVMGRALAFGLNMHQFHTHHAERVRPHSGLDLQEVAQLRAQLTALQQAVLDGFEQGQDDAQIAARLGISCEAVDYHRRQLQWRFDARRRMQQDVMTAPVAARN
jgi:DNA-binding CsgD family transcriptional regulator